MKKISAQKTHEKKSAKNNFAQHLSAKKIVHKKNLLEKKCSKFIHEKKQCTKKKSAENFF